MANEFEKVLQQLKLADTRIYQLDSLLKDATRNLKVEQDKNSKLINMIKDKDKKFIELKSRINTILSNHK